MYIMYNRFLFPNIRTTVYKLYFKWWKEVYASLLYKDDVSNLHSADTVKITFHNAKVCYMDSFL